MTKSWEDVKQTACQLYLNGATLSQVQEQLEERFGFKASARSFRLKFKAWGITRSSQLRELRAQDHHEANRFFLEDDSRQATGTLSAPMLVIPERASSEPTESVTLTPYSRSPISQTATLVPSPQSVRLERDTSMALSPLDPRIQAVHHPAHESEPILLNLQKASTGTEISEILENAPFIPTEDSVLHYAAARADVWILEYILDYLPDVSPIGFTIDTEDSQHRTSLERAILARRSESVELLLRYGASTRKRNGDGQTPLHFAISMNSPVEIIDALLKYNADVNASLLRKNNRTMTPVHLAMERFDSVKYQAAKDNMSSIIDTLISHAADLSLGDPSDPMIASAQSAFFNTFARWNRPQGSFRLIHFLRADRNPMSWIPRKHCPGGNCRTLASFVFSHTPSSGLSGLLIEATDVAKYGHTLLHTLLAPCLWKTTSNTDVPMYKLVEDLLQRMRNEGASSPDDHIMRHILEHAPEPDKLNLMEMMHEWGIATSTEARELLKELPRENTDYRLRLSEQLIHQLDLDAPNFLGRGLMTRYFGSGRMFLRHQTMNADARREVRIEAIRSLGMDPHEMANEAQFYIIQSIIHLFTKSLLQGDTFGLPVSNQQRVFGAVQLRQSYKLPPLPVPDELVLSIFPHLDHRSRGTVVETLSDDSDPDDALVALPGGSSHSLARNAYDTPASIDWS